MSRYCSLFLRDLHAVLWIGAAATQLFFLQISGSGSSSASWSRDAFCSRPEQQVLSPHACRLTLRNQFGGVNFSAIWLGDESRRDRDRPTQVQDCLQRHRLQICRQLAHRTLVSLYPLENLYPLALSSSSSPRGFTQVTNSRSDDQTICRGGLRSLIL